MLVEVMIGAGTLVIAVLGAVQFFTYCQWQSERAGNLVSAMNEAYGRLEEIGGLNFDDITQQYDPAAPAGTSFSTTQLDGMGVVCVDDTNPDLLQVTVVVSWRDRGSVIVGEDRNLNGVLDAEEDHNNNGRLDSPVSLAALVARKSGN